MYKEHLRVQHLKYRNIALYTIFILTHFPYLDVYTCDIWIHSTYEQHAYNESIICLK